MIHRSILCSTWDDPWFAELPPKAKLLFIFLITNRRVTQCGAMEITVRQIAFETGLATSEIPNLIESFDERVCWSHQHSLLFVRNFYRHQRANTGDKFDIAARKSAEVLPVFAKEWVYGVYPHLAPDGYTHPIPTPVPPPLPPRSHAISEAEAEAEAVVEDVNPPTPQRGKSARQESPEFKAFYDAYPRHQGRDAARRAWSKLAPSATLIAEINTGLQALLPEYGSRPPDKVPAPATFLNGARWLDTPLPPSTINGSTNGYAVDRPRKNGRAGYTLDELKALAQQGESDDGKRDDQTTHDARFRVVE